jgi:hypothetical protein
MFKKIKLNKKGQAAATDALLFLSIVAIVFVFIVGYSMTYGANIVEGTKKLYNNTFHYSALKAFMSASYGRDGEDILHSQAQDNVVTMIKEDYGANSLINYDDTAEDELVEQKRLLSDQTKIAILAVLNDLFRILPQRSYLLLITHDASGTNTLQPLILFINTYVDSERVSYVCYPQTNDVLEPYLQQHTLDLEVAEGNFNLYRHILSEDSPSESRGIKNEDGSIFLASWISNDETDESRDWIESKLRCVLQHPITN